MYVSKIWELSNSQIWGGNHMNVGIKVEMETKGMGWKGVKREDGTENYEKEDIMSWKWQRAMEKLN